MTTERFNELGYVLPPEAPELYADRAVTVLENLIENDPETAVYLLQPSSVLLLAGLRAGSPYHTFGPEVTSEQKAALDTALDKHGIRRSAHEDDASFTLFTPSCVNDIAKRYTYFADKLAMLPESASDEQMSEWMSAMDEMIVGLMERDELSREWLIEDGWGQNNLSFGMLLGYPGQAITSALYAGAAGDITGQQTLAQTIIAPVGEPYFGTEVSYDVHPSVKDSDEIRRHSRLWRKTLEIVYATLPFEDLLQDERFRKAYNSLAARETK